MLKGLRGLHIDEERELAGKVAGALYLTGTATVAVMLLLPGVVSAHWPVVLGAAGFAGLWGVLCLTVIPWRTAPPIVSHFSVAMGLPLTAVSMASTGGAQSPAKFYLFFVVVYCGYFYPPKEALAYLLGCVAVHALPLAYDRSAVSEGFLGEILIAGPSYLVLGWLILAGKRLMVNLHEAALSLSQLDPLTGLYNRRALLERMDEHVGGTRASDRVGLLLLDLDSFKDANTVYGHPGGDRVLCATADALRGVARESDTVARLGGDEFAVLALDTDAEAMELIAERMLDGVRAAVLDLDMPLLELTGSVGWALHPEDASTPTELIAAADVCMRRAKASGKNRVQSPLDWTPDPA